MQPPEQPQSVPTVTIVGAGIIGASTAYHLSQHNRRAVVFDQTPPASGASGRAGGFLARDWCDTTPVRNLARPSFSMHEAQATTLGPDISYRPLRAYTIALASPHAKPTPKRPSRRALPRPQNLHWLDGHALHLAPPRTIGTEESIAQVHPRKLTYALLDAAKQAVGTEVIQQRVENVTRDEQQGRWVLSVRPTDKEDAEPTEHTTDVLVLAMGPWSIRARDWFPSLPPILAHKAASLVIPVTLPATALFTEYTTSTGRLREPEAYPRHDEVYLCQSAVPRDLPEHPLLVDVDKNDVADLKEFAAALNAELGEAVKDSNSYSAQACYLPTSPDGLPVIGELPNTNGSVFVATGHSCWGILNSPATGKAVAELIVKGESSINISAFAPNRFA